jgi:NAD(P)-dependent dehydrogenase (short-subunit alcohol dehydrogenase family)
MGLATARLAAKLGARVVAAGRRRLEERDPLAGVTQARVDTTDEASVKALFDDVGELDHLFASSSPGSPGPLLEQELQSARSFIDGKLLGSWLCARYAAPRMRAGGSITLLSG